MYDWIHTYMQKRTIGGREDGVALSSTSIGDGWRPDCIMMRCTKRVLSACKNKVLVPYETTLGQMIISVLDAAPTYQGFLIGD